MQNRNKWLALINIPIQMGAIIFAFHYLGQWLDENYSNINFNYHKVSVLAGVFISLYNVYRQVNDIGKL